MKSVKAVPALFMTGVMLLTSGCVQKILGGISGKGKEYDSIIEKWKEGNTFEDEASKDAIGALFAASDAKDHDEFKECFTEESRTKLGFDGRIDEFTDAFPKGLSEAELTYVGGGAGGSVDYDSFVRGAAYNYTCTLNGEWYFVSVSFCFRNDKHPEEIGVEQFLVMNLNSRAYHIDYLQD